ncbi:hypothetical protein, partial [Stutzerimonas kunmingensis]|uniref:hypothetical protein n=1 Tax=Stutzerimonas kunmingensis TaxID=1211807 RepID=UPI00241C3B8E
KNLFFACKTRSLVSGLKLSATRKLWQMAVVHTPCGEARSMLEQSRYAKGGVLGWSAPSDRRWVGHWVRLLDRVLHTNKTDEELP